VPPATPNAPSNLTASLSNLVNVSLSWDASESAVSYNVLRDGQLIGTTQGTSYSDNGLNFETNYVYFVSAANFLGDESEYSEVSITTDSEPFNPVAPRNLTAEPGDEQVSLSWNPPSGGGGGFPACPDGSGDYADCSGACFLNDQCASGGYDCCVDDGGCTDIDSSGLIVDWLGDGYCDDGSYGLFYDCDEYGNDCGDCAGNTADPLGICDGDIFECTCDEGINNLSVSGITDIDGDGIDDDCFLDDTTNTYSNYFVFNWEGCNVSDIYWGINDVFENGGNFGTFGSGLVFYGFGPSETYQFMLAACEGEFQSNIANGSTSDVDCGSRLELQFLRIQGKN